MGLIADLKRETEKMFREKTVFNSNRYEYGSKKHGMYEPLPPASVRMTTAQTETAKPHKESPQRKRAPANPSS